jgi:hypothetical protein
MRSPKDIEEKLDKMITAWNLLAPAKSFGGMTRQEFEEACFPSKETRGLIEELQIQLARAIDQRDAADKVSAAKMQLVVAGVLADPTEGPDSALYEAFGYTRKSERKSGLTRKGTEPPSE